MNLHISCLVPGGIITLDDLLEYQPLLNEDPPRLNVGEYTMHVPDAPSSGPVLALILNIVDGERWRWRRSLAKCLCSRAEERMSGFPRSSLE